MTNADVKRPHGAITSSMGWAKDSTEQQVRNAISPVVLTGSVRLAELLGLVALAWALQRVLASGEQQTALSAAIIAVIAGSAILLLQSLGTYQIAAFRYPHHQFRRVILAWALVCIAAAGLANGLGFDKALPWRWLAAWFGAGLALVLLGRLALALLVRHWTREGRLLRRCVIVGGGREGELLIKLLALAKDLDLCVCGVFDDRDGERSPAIVAGVPKLGTVNDLVHYTRSNRVDLVLVSLPLTAEDRLLQMVRKLWVLPVDIRLAAHISRLHFRPRAYSYIGGVPVLPITDRPITDWNMVLKAVFDRVVAALLLLFLSPVFLATAIAIKLDSKGPVLFRQRRLGFNNELSRS